MERLTLMHDTHGKIGLIQSNKNLIERYVTNLSSENYDEQLANIYECLNNINKNCKDLVVVLDKWYTEDKAKNE